MPLAGGGRVARPARGFGLGRGRARAGRLRPAKVVFSPQPLTLSLISSHHLKIWIG